MFSLQDFKLEDRAFSKTSALRENVITEKPISALVLLTFHLAVITLSVMRTSHADQIRFGLTRRLVNQEVKLAPFALVTLTARPEITAGSSIMSKNSSPV